MGNEEIERAWSTWGTEKQEQFEENGGPIIMLTQNIKDQQRAKDKKYKAEI